MGTYRLASLAVLVLWVTAAWGQPNRGDPHLGYLYPAGGQQGTTFRVTAGGQNLRGASAAVVSADGVHVTVIEYIPPLLPGVLGDVAKHLRALAAQRTAEMQGRPGGAPRPKPARAGKEEPEELPPLPDHPLLRGLEQKGLEELLELRELLFNPKRQLNMQIAEQVTLEVTVDPTAAPGDRELRLITEGGLTNPLLFEAGGIPEVVEDEPNDPGKPLVRPGAPVDLPVLLNGQIMPGDVDRFRFRAQQGQSVVVETHARRLVPYLADAVPGWFQATVALYDAAGAELAFADDFRFNPDPVLHYRIPAAGEYDLEVRDSIYRGREDFVYRVAVGERPFITQLFPLGGRTGSATTAQIDGWNLPANQLPLDTQPGGPALRTAALPGAAGPSNAVTYAVDDLPESTETEPNDSSAHAQPVSLGLTINGRIGQPGDVDVFRLKGRGGEEIAAEVLARRLQSPLDSLLRLMDASGQVLEWNDDHVDRGSGLLTHHADSYLRAQLPKSGDYFLRLSDSEDHGGAAYGYRLRVAAPHPDFALRVTPSSLNIRAGLAALVWVHALREDGFAGDIEVSLAGAPTGFALQGGRILAGRDSIRMTVSGPPQAPAGPLLLQLQGSAQIGGQTVTHAATPADDMMQAFVYRHLAPAGSLMAMVVGQRRFAPTMGYASQSPARLPQGGTVTVELRLPRGPLVPRILLELADPPAGITLEETRDLPTGVALVLRSAPDAPAVGYADNLILNAFIEMERKDKDGAPTGQKRRIPLGVLPAIPLEITAG
jgi:hypothetical protein